MKKSILTAYLLVAVLLLWSLAAGNSEFLFYGLTAVGIVVVLHLFDRQVDFSPVALWAFNVWLVAHIAGGLIVINGQYLYSTVLIPIVGDPYLILKYDQLIHWYCYLMVALLLWSIVSRYQTNMPRYLLVLLTVFAAAGIGGVNEIIEFLATVFIENVNVGGYENTAIDIVANMLGAISAIPLFKYIDKNKFK